MQRKRRVEPRQLPEKRAIRKRIRTIGLIRVLEEIANFCFHEAEQYRLRWGDPQFAKVWERRGELIHRVAQSLRAEELRDPRPIKKAIKPKVPLLEFFRRK